MKLLIIDDEPLARLIVKEYLQSFPALDVVQECADGFEGLKAIKEHQPDLVILDIQMPKINGFEMLELADPAPAVIFTTAFDEYAIKAFETHAVDYLMKPFSKTRFEAAINKWLDTKTTFVETTASVLAEASLSPQQRQRIVVKNGTKIKIIPVQDVLFLEAADDYVKIYTTEGSFLKNKTMSHFEHQLEATQFVRCHRSYMLNISQVIKIDAYEKDGHIAILRSGHKVPVSRSGYLKLREVLDL